MTLLNTTRPHVVFCAGGTGGHLFPALATAKELRGKANVTLLTDHSHVVEKDITVIPYSLVKRKKGWRVIFFMTSLIKAFFKSLFYFLKTKPDLVVGFGGYTSVPMVFAAQILNINTVVHEQNAYLGRANRFLAKRAKFLALSFPSTHAVPSSCVTHISGNPVRLHPHPSFDHYESPHQIIKLLVMGGSQGAAFFSTVLPKAFALLTQQQRQCFHVTQQARQELLASTQKAYDDMGMKVTVAPFFEDMDALYQKTHFCITRSGASTVFELLRSGRPSIMVPYTYAMDNHQYYNATYAKEGGWLMEEKEITPEKLASLFIEILNNPSLLSQKSKALRALSMDDAAVNLARLITSVLASRT